MALIKMRKKRTEENEMPLLDMHAAYVTFHFQNMNFHHIIISSLHLCIYTYVHEFNSIQCVFETFSPDVIDFDVGV